MNGGAPTSMPGSDRTDVESQPATIEQELVTTRLQLRRALASLDETRARCHELESSTSWRITAPLRAIRLLFQRTARQQPARDSSSQFTLPDDRPVIPRALCNLAMQADPEPNRTYRLVDARDAMAPLTLTSAIAVGRQTRIAVLCSAELVADMSGDADLSVLARQSWRDRLQPGRFDYLLVEPAWQLADPSWGYCMSHEGEERTELLELFARCREFALPIVLWVRDDFEAYESCAWLGDAVDRIYAIDERMVSNFRSTHPDKPVALLPLAIQPALHNPIRSQALFESAAEFRDKTLYDGWYDLLAREDRHELATKLGRDTLRVCESEWDFGSVRIGDADGLERNILGCVNSLDKNALGKLFASEVFLADGLRPDWRKRQAMLRAIACGSLVLAEGDGSVGAVMPAGAVRWMDRERIGGMLQWGQEHELERAHALHVTRRHLLKEHTYSQRLARIADDLGMTNISHANESPRVSIILVTKRPHLLAGCIDRFRSDVYSNKELVVIMHGEHNPGESRRLVRGDEAIRIHSLDAHHSLGACLNFAIRETESPYWCKMDDDDFYGPSYLEDIMLARKMVDFDVAGKSPVFTYMQQQHTLFWDPDWFSHANLLYTASDRRSALIAGATILAKRDAVDGVGFSERRRAGADSQFIGDCLDGGARVLSTDPFGFVRFRGGVDGAHTWRMDEDDFVRRARPLGGRNAIEEAAFA